MDQSCQCWHFTEQLRLQAYLLLLAVYCTPSAGLPAAVGCLLKAYVCRPTCCCWQFTGHRLQAYLLLLAVYCTPSAGLPAAVGSLLNTVCRPTCCCWLFTEHLRQAVPAQLQHTHVHRKAVGIAIPAIREQ